MEVKNTVQAKTQEEITKILDTNGITYNMAKCCSCNGVCISFGNNQNCCRNSSITLQTCNKDICKIYLHEILYIAIENRKSVLYLTDRKIETNYSIDHWKNVLDEKVYAQPHYSYIVNLNYVIEVTKELVTLKYADKTYSVYTSSRRIGAFKKAFLNFKG